MPNAAVFDLDLNLICHFDLYFLFVLLVVGCGHSENSSITKLNMDHNLVIKASSRTCVALELVLCQLRNSNVAAIDATDQNFSDDDSTAIARGLRCAR